MVKIDNNIVHVYDYKLKQKEKSNNSKFIFNIYIKYLYLLYYMYLLFTLKKDEKIIFYKICAATKLKLKLLFKSNHIQKSIFFIMSTLNLGFAKKNQKNQKKPNINNCKK